MYMIYSDVEVNMEDDKAVKPLRDIYQEAGVVFVRLASPKNSTAMNVTLVNIEKHRVSAIPSTKGYHWVSIEGFGSYRFVLKGAPAYWYIKQKIWDIGEGYSDVLFEFLSKLV